MKPMLMDAVAQTWIFKLATAVWAVALYIKFVNKSEFLNSSLLEEAYELKQKVNALREEVQFSKQSIDELRGLN
jgi:hypothetical protein